MDSTDDHVKLVDFGFARSYTGANGELMRTPCCTLNYAAPEVLHQAISKSSAHSSNLKKKDYSSLYNTNGYDNTCDVSLSNDLLSLQIYNVYFSLQAWSLGTVLFTMLTGRIPFQSYALKKHDASDANFILNRIIAKDEFNLDSPLWPTHLNFSSQAKSVITGLLTVNPARRLTINQLMRHPWLSQFQTIETPLMQSYQSALCPCKGSDFVCIYGTSCPNCVTSSSLPQPIVTSTSLSSSSGSAEEPSLKCSLTERKRTLKMKLKKKHTITSPRKHGKKSKVVDHFEVLKNEEVDDDESAPVLPIDNRLSVVYKKGPSATSYNSAYDSGIQSLTSHHQSCSTTSSNSSTGSRGSNGTTGIFYNHLEQSNNTKSLSSTFSRCSQANAHSTTANNTSLQLQHHQHLMSTQSAKLPFHVKETVFSSDMCYTSSAPFYPATPYSTNLAKSHHSGQPYRDSIIPENKVTAYLATLKEECDPITETPVIEKRSELDAHCGSVFDCNTLAFSSQPSQATETKRLKRSSSRTDDTLLNEGLTHFERSNHQRQEQTKAILETSISNCNSSFNAKVTGKRAAYEQQHTGNTTLNLPTNLVSMTSNCKWTPPKTRRQKRPRPPTIVLDD